MNGVTLRSTRAPLLLAWPVAKVKAPSSIRKAVELTAFWLWHHARIKTQTTTIASAIHMTRLSAEKIFSPARNMSVSWAIDTDMLGADVRSKIIDWAQRTAAQTGLDEGRFVFVRKRPTTRQAMCHNLRNLARAWKIELPEGCEWLHEVDLVKAEDNVPRQETPEPANIERRVSTPEVYKSLLPPEYPDMVRQMLMVKASA